MNIKLLLLAALLGLTACVTTPLPPENGPDHPVQLPPPTVPDDPDYNPHLLIPHYDADKKLWGYIDRTSREEVIPHMFHFAERVQREYGLATVHDKEWSKEDIYRITPDGKYKMIHEGKVEHGQQKARLRSHRRTGDDYFYMSQGSYYALFDPSGKKLWDTLAPRGLFSLAGGYPAYLGEGHVAMINGAFTEIRDRNFKTISRFDTTEYAMIIPKEYDWVRRHYASPPLITMLDLKNEKVGFINHFGKQVIPFEYDYWPGIELQNVRNIYGVGGVGKFIYLPNQYGQVVVLRDGDHWLISEQNDVLYKCPDSTGFSTDPHFQYNPVENSIVLSVRGTFASQFVLDLDENKIRFSGEKIVRLNNGLYAIEPSMFGSGKQNQTYLVDAHGQKVASHFDDKDGEVTFYSDNRADCGLWFATYKGKSGVIDSFGKVVVPFDYDNVELMDSDRSVYYIKAIIRDEDRQKFAHMFLSDGTKVGGPITYDGSADTDWNFLTNWDWKQESIYNALFFFITADQGIAYQGYIDFFGHSFITLEN